MLNNFPSDQFSAAMTAIANKLNAVAIKVVSFHHPFDGSRQLSAHFRQLRHGIPGLEAKKPPPFLSDVIQRAMQPKIKKLCLGHHLSSQETTYLTTESSPSHMRLPGSPVLVRLEYGSVRPRERSNNLTKHCARFNCGDSGPKILHKLMQENPTTVKFLLHMMTKKPAFYLMISVAMSDHDVVLLLPRSHFSFGPNWSPVCLGLPGELLSAYVRVGTKGYTGDFFAFGSP